MEVLRVSDGTAASGNGERRGTGVRGEWCVVSGD